MKTQYFLLILLFIISFFLIQLFSPFLKPILVAFLLAIATNAINRVIHTKIANEFVVASAMTLLLGCLFFVPIGYFFVVAIGFFGSFDPAQITVILEKIKVTVFGLPDEFSYIKVLLNDAFLELNNQQMIDKLVSFSGDFGKIAASFSLDMIFILVFYFLFNLYGYQISDYIKEILPFRKQDTNELLYETGNVMSVVFYSILVTAIFQGFLFGIFVYFFGYDGLLFGVLYGFASLIPIIGGALMWVPLSGYEFMNGNTTNAIWIASYTIIVISLIADTFIKPIIIKYINTKVVRTPTNVNELLIFFSIVAGLGTFGFWGMIIGPALVTFFISILKLLKQFIE